MRSFATFVACSFVLVLPLAAQEAEEIVEELVEDADVIEDPILEEPILQDVEIVDELELDDEVVAEAVEWQEGELVEVDGVEMVLEESETQEDGLIDLNEIPTLSDDETSGFDDLLDDLLDGEGMGTESGRGDALTGWKGFLEMRPRTYFRARDQAGRNDEQLLFEGEFEFDFSLADDVTGYFRPRMFLDGLDSELRRFEPYEAYVTFERYDGDVRVGQFVENWGIADTFNPVDVVNRRDFGTDVLDADRLGELGVRYRQFFDGNDVVGEPTLSVYALPVFRETPFAPRKQRFGVGGFFDVDDSFRPTGLEQAFFAARYNSTLATSFADADVQVLVARGPERVPTFIPGPTLRPAYFGVTTVGAGIRAVPNEDVAGEFLSTLTLKAELAYKTPYTFDDSPVDSPDDYFQMVLGVDRGFYGVFSELDDLTFTVEYAREDGAEDPAALLRPFRNDLIVRGLWEANDFERQSMELRGIFDLEEDESIVELLYERQLRAVHPDVQLEVELRLFDAEENGATFFSLFPNNSSLAVGLRWDF